MLIPTRRIEQPRSLHARCQSAHASRRPCSLSCTALGGRQLRGGVDSESPSIHPSFSTSRRACFPFRTLSTSDYNLRRPPIRSAVPLTSCITLPPISGTSRWAAVCACVRRISTQVIDNHASQTTQRIPHPAATPRTPPRSQRRCDRPAHFIRRQVLETTFRKQRETASGRNACCPARAPPSSHVKAGR